jgi:hypothetical protein
VGLFLWVGDLLILPGARYAEVVRESRRRSSRRIATLAAFAVVAALATPSPAAASAGSAATYESRDAFFADHVLEGAEDLESLPTGASSCGPDNDGDGRADYEGGSGALTNPHTLPSGLVVKQAVGCLEAAYDGTTGDTVFILNVGSTIDFPAGVEAALFSFGRAGGDGTYGLSVTDSEGVSTSLEGVAPGGAFHGISVPGGSIVRATVTKGVDEFGPLVLSGVDFASRRTAIAPGGGSAPAGPELTYSLTNIGYLYLYGLRQLSKPSENSYIKLRREAWTGYPERGALRRHRPAPAD